MHWWVWSLRIHWFGTQQNWYVLTLAQLKQVKRNSKNIRSWLFDSSTPLTHQSKTSIHGPWVQMFFIFQLFPKPWRFSQAISSLKSHCCNQKGSLQPFACDFTRKPSRCASKSLRGHVINGPRLDEIEKRSDTYLSGWNKFLEKNNLKWNIFVLCGWYCFHVHLAAILWYVHLLNFADVFGEVTGQSFIQMTGWNDRCEGPFD